MTRWSLSVILLSTLVSGCDGRQNPVPTAPTATSFPFTPPTADARRVEGIVFEQAADARRPIQGARIVPWLQQERRGFRLAAVFTDAEGRFRISDASDGFLVLYAEKAGYRQPCAAALTVASENRADIQLVTDEALLRDATLGQIATLSPRLSGIVYEPTPDGRKPFAGALMFYEWSPDLVTAMTRSDAQGRYVMCRLPAGSVTVTALKQGARGNGPTIQFLGDMTLDLDIVQ